MAFGMEGKPQEHWSKQNLDIAVLKLQEAPPRFGDDGDTGTRGDKYFAMGLELTKEDYEAFLLRLHQMFDQTIGTKGDELRNAA